MTTIIPTTHPGNPSDATASLRFSTLYILGATAIGGVVVAGFLFFSMIPDTDNLDPTLITDIIPYDIPDILDGSASIFVMFSFLMLCIILPLQSPGWWAIWKASRKLRSLPKEAYPLSLVIVQGIAWAAAVAYLWFAIGVGVAVCGFEIHLALLNPQFTWIQPENTGIGDLFWMIGQALWLLAVIACIQLPIWFGLWSLNRPVPTPPTPDDPRWQSWHKRAVIYLKGSTVITVVTAVFVFGYRGLERYWELIESGHELDISFGLFVLFANTIVTTIYVLPILLFIQSPGWLIMAWLERWRRQAAGIPRSHTGPLRLLQGTAIGYLAMIMAAWMTWWLRLQYVDIYDRDMLIPYLTPVLDVLLWAQIPGWIAFALWFVLWLNQIRKYPAL